LLATSARRARAGLFQPDDGIRTPTRAWKDLGPRHRRAV